MKSWTPPLTPGSSLAAGRREHEFEGQPIEQIRMRRQRPLDAEIVFGLDKALAEVLLPDAIHDDARRQRIVRRQSQRARSSRLAGRPFTSSGLMIARTPGST